MVYTFYKFTNKINGKNYVGITQERLKVRVQSHFSRSKNLKHDYLFMRALRKYPRDLWNIEILEMRGGITRKEAQYREDALIVFYNNLDPSKGYNTQLSTYNPSNPFQIPVHQYALSGEYIREWRGAAEASRGINKGIGTISSVVNGRTVSAHGFQWSHDKVDNIGDARSKCDYDARNVNSRKLILQLSLDTGKPINSYRSLTDAAKEFPESSRARANISQCCKGGRNSACGFGWVYEGEPNNHKTSLNRLHQYDLSGEFIKTFRSTRSACIEVSGNRRCKEIQDCRDGSIACGFRWSKEYKEHL